MYNPRLTTKTTKQKVTAILLISHLMSRRGDSNARPPRPERGALPTALLLVMCRFPSHLSVAAVGFWCLPCTRFEKAVEQRHILKS